MIINNPLLLTCISTGGLEMTLPVVVVALNNRTAVPMETPLMINTELTLVSLTGNVLMKASVAGLTGGERGGKDV